MLKRTQTQALRLLPLWLAVLPCSLFAQAPPTPADSLIFTNGEQLSGDLEKADASGITFKSPMTGEITVKWANIKELRSDKNFAVLSAKTKLTRKDALAIVPQGKVTVEDKNIVVSTSTGPKTVPISDANLIVDAAGFDKAVNHQPGLLAGWTGAVSGGASLVRATQDSTTFNGAVTLVRAIPNVSWLPARNRTLVEYSQSYGTTSQIGDPTIKTNIFHADGERDEYFSPRVFGFGLLSFDHNFSQGLDLQQSYGGGIGATVIRSAVQELDVRGDVHYEKQQFFTASSNLNLFGSTFSETYLRHLPRTILLNEVASIVPAWNDTHAYSAHAGVTLTFPVYKGFAFNIGAMDDYLNNAPPGFRKNSVQFTSGIAYVIK